VDDPLALEPREKIVTLRSIRNDPLARLHSHRQIDEAQYQRRARVPERLGEAERGPRALDPARGYVDGVADPRADHRGAARGVLRLNRAERELGRRRIGVGA
jgi:hypothetical protein